MIFISGATWKGEAWYPCCHYEKLIVSFFFQWTKMITSLPRLPQQVDKTVKKRIIGLTQCYCLGILTEVGYIFLFIITIELWDPWGIIFDVMLPAWLKTHQSFVISEHKTHDVFEKIKIIKYKNNKCGFQKILHRAKRSTFGRQKIKN